MTRIDFYVLRSATTHDRQLLACRLTDKAYQLGHRVFIRTDSPAQSRVMDDLLWTFRAGSFVPHAIGGEAHGAQPPVVLGHEREPPYLDDVMINLSSEVPAGFDRFQRVIELVDQEASIRQAGRCRYRYYQDNDYALTTHKLDGSQ